MSVQTRTTALQNEIVRLYFTFEIDGRLSNPAAQPLVEIIDTDGVTVLDTLQAQIENTGIWYADWYVPANLPLGSYYDRWTYQWSALSGVKESVQTFSVYGLESYINFISPAIAQSINSRVAQMMKDLSNEFIYEAMHISVYWGQAMRIQQENQAKRVKKYYYFTLDSDRYEVSAGAVYFHNGQRYTIFESLVPFYSSSSSSESDSSSLSTGNVSMSSSSSSSSSVDSHSSLSSSSISSSSSIFCCISPFCEGTDCSHLTAWTFTGFDNSNSDNCTLYVTLNNDFVSQQVFIYKDVAKTQLVSYGTRTNFAGSGAITLTAQNSSGLNGTVNWDAVSCNSSLRLACEEFSSSSSVSGESESSTSTSGVFPATTTTTTLWHYQPILTTVGTGTPLSSGTLTKISGTGPDTITFVGYEEKTSRFSTIYSLAYQNWNQDPRPIVRLNNRIVDDGWFVDWNGKVYIDGLMAPEDSINVTYNFAYFSPEEILSFLDLGLKMMNSQPPASVIYNSLVTIPAEWEAPVILYAAITALRRLIFGLNFQEKMIIFGEPDQARQAISSFQQLYTDYTAIWQESAKNAKTRRLYGMAQFVTPEYTLPGGRSRWFRYLYKTGS